MVLPWRSWRMTKRPGPSCLTFKLSLFHRRGCVARKSHVHTFSALYTSSAPHVLLHVGDICKTLLSLFHAGCDVTENPTKPEDVCGCI